MTTLNIIQMYNIRRRLQEAHCRKERSDIHQWIAHRIGTAHLCIINQFNL